MVPVRGFLGHHITLLRTFSRAWRNAKWKILLRKDFKRYLKHAEVFLDTRHIPNDSLNNINSSCVSGARNKFPQIWHAIPVYKLDYGWLFELHLIFNSIPLSKRVLQ